MILLTGGAGFIGTALVRALVKRGERVRVLDNGTRGDVRRLYQHISPLEIWEMDVRDEEAVIGAAKGCDEIIHLAYINGTKLFYQRPNDVLDVGVRGMLSVLAAAKHWGIGRLLLASSSEVCRAEVGGMNEVAPLVIPDPFNPRYSYSAGKIISEMLAIHSGLFHTLRLIRPYNIYGPDMHEGHVIPDFAKQLRERINEPDDPLPFTILGSANETRSFCYIDDFIEGVMTVRQHGQHMGIYNIGTPEETTIGDLARHMAKLFGRQLVISEARELREGSIPRRKPDISKLVALGYQPKVPLEEGLRRVLCQ